MYRLTEWDVPEMLAAAALILGAVVLLIRSRSSISIKMGDQKRDLTSSAWLASTAIAVLTVVGICNTKFIHPVAPVLTPSVEA
jgi:hypothetical protein